MIILCLSQKNRNSIFALLGILETYGYELINDVILFDTKNLSFDKKIKKNQKHYFLFSFSTQQKNKNFELLKTLKNIYKKSIFICGGPHPTGAPKDCLNNGFDLVVKGEAENLINEIFSNKNFETIKSDKFSDINFFPPFPLKAPYFSLYIEITRGCPYNCFYCQTSQIFGLKPRHRSIDNILKYCEVLIKNNRTDLRFVSPNALSYGSETGTNINFCALENLLKSLYKLVNKKGRIFFGSFPSEIRPEFINEDVIILLKNYCSNKKIMIGAQSGSENILKKINRNHSVEDIIKAAKIVLKYGFTPHIDIISGFPFENEKDINKTITLCEKLINIGCKIHIHKFTPLPGTKFENLPSIEFSKDFKSFINKWLSKGIIYGNI